MFAFDGDFNGHEVVELLDESAAMISQLSVCGAVTCWPKTTTLQQNLSCSAGFMHLTT